MTVSDQRNQHRKRIEATRSHFDEWGVEGILVGSPSNRRWLSGFTGSAGWLLVTRDRASLGTDFRYWEQAAAQSPEFELFRLKGGPQEILTQFVSETGARTIGLESEHTTLRTFEWLKSADTIEWVPLESVFGKLRQIKDPTEIAAMRAAAAIGDEAMSQVNRLARLGMSERELAWALEQRMREAGAGLAFEIIVAFGPNAARSHHRAGETVLAEGMPVIVDLGATIDGYNSDLTRSFFAGRRPDGQFERIYDLVYAAQQAALSGLRPGFTGKVIDALARDVITAAGHGSDFGHSLGHGVGLDVHEDPRLSMLADNQPLPAGAVVTVEPGVYISGWGGIRIEDLVLLTEDGYELLSHCPKDPILPL